MLFCFWVAVLWYAHYLQTPVLTVYSLESEQVKSEIQILHLTDFHIRRNSETWSTILDRLDLEKIEMVILTGDFTDMDCSLPLLKKVLDRLRDIPWKFAILGNHDYESIDWTEFLKPHLYGIDPQTIHRDPEKTISLLESSGVRVLDNQLFDLTINDTELRMIGIADACMELHNPDLLERIDPARLNIVLTHSLFPQLLQTSREVPVFAGHSHGGQLTLPGFGPLTSNAKNVPRRYARGILDHHIIANAGLGTTGHLPLRFFCPPEVVITRIRPANS